MNCTTITQERISYVSGSGVLQWSMVELVDMFAWPGIVLLPARSQKSHTPRVLQPPGLQQLRVGIRFQAGGAELHYL